jgi:hypothetical protein
LKFGLFFIFGGRGGGGGGVHFICSSLYCFPNWKKYFNVFVIGKNILMTAEEVKLLMHGGTVPEHLFFSFFFSLLLFQES